MRLRSLRLRSTCLSVQSFRWAFLAYLIIPFLMLSIQVMALSWWNEWLALGLSDVIEVGSYVILGWCAARTSRGS